MTIENYGQDGVPHLTYYDKATTLSFVTDPVHHGKVAVSDGGYAEAVIDVFEIVLEDVDRLDTYMYAFKRACQAYVQGWNARYAREMAQEPEETYR